VDYLIVDMPPGTGDIQLTLSQQVAVSGAVIVTTPQNIALADAVKGIEMFQKVNIPILGVVENMSFFECDQCGKRHEIFDNAGGKTVANDYSTRVLGEFPLHPSIRSNTDAGNPPVVSEPDSEISELFRQAARRTAASLWENANQQAAAPTIVIDNE
jgi:ATP-binding protein involved in chromosome partitioning